MFQMRVAALRHRLRPHEIPAAIKAIMDEKQVALRGMRERHQAARHSDRVVNQR